VSLKGTLFYLNQTAMSKTCAFLIALLLFLCSFRIYSQHYTVHNYSPTSEIFNNPERGFYKYTERRSARGELSVSMLEGYRNEGYTLIYRIYYMGNYVDKPIAREYLDRIREDFQAIRSAGIKVVLRFAYTSRSTEPYGDATPGRVMEHVAQLKPILQENADVIAVMQAGFIGAWGEWYYTDYFATGSPDNVTPEDLQERADLVYALLDALPAERQIQLRYVGYKIDIFGEQPISPEEAYSGTPKSRIAHHNDCFVSSNNDVGTYHSAYDRTYLKEDSKYTAVGGETCRWYEPRSNCDTTLVEMERYHWSFINIDYFGTTIQHWKDDGCFDDIQRKLGYRYSLVSGLLQDQSKPGGTMQGSLALVNQGFTNPYNPRNIEIILRHRPTGEAYYLPVVFDLRTVPTGDTATIEFEAGIPDSAPSGDYDLFLNLPDPMLTVKRDPRYAIRLANEDTWEETTGYNRLLHTLNIDPSHNVPDYTGTGYFTLLDENSHIDPELDPAPELFVNQYSGNAVLYWGLVEGNSKFTVIERSVNGSEFAAITLLSPDVPSYTDKELTPGNTYNYRTFLSDNHVGTPYSNTVSTVPDTTLFRYPTITIDGTAGDWRPVAPVVTAFQTNTWAAFFFADTGHLNISLRGVHMEGFQCFLETDGDHLTGGDVAYWDAEGMDYMISGDSLFHFDAGWVFSEPVPEYHASDSLIELRIPFSLIALDTSQQIIRTGLQVFSGDDTVCMPFRHNPPAVYERVIPPDPPSGLRVTPSAETPSEKLIIQWETCNDCDGYFLERSAGSPDAFELLATPGAGSYKYIDTGLENHTDYYYRISSFNFAGPSNFTGPATGYTHSLGIDGQETDSVFRIFPNPAGDRLCIQISEKGPDECSFRLFDFSGREVLGRSMHAPFREIIIPVDQFTAGIYLLQLESARGIHNRKIIIY
jgi:hypothetical protein